MKSILSQFCQSPGAGGLFRSKETQRTWVHVLWVEFLFLEVWISVSVKMLFFSRFALSVEEKKIGGTILLQSNPAMWLLLGFYFSGPSHGSCTLVSSHYWAYAYSVMRVPVSGRWVITWILRVLAASLATKPLTRCFLLIFVGLCSACWARKFRVHTNTSLVWLTETANNRLYRSTQNLRFAAMFNIIRKQTNLFTLNDSSMLP